MNKKFLFLFSAIFSLVLILSATNAISAQSLTQSNVIVQPYEVIHIVNLERSKAGLKPLAVHTGAMVAAEKRALEAIETFSHDRPDGRPWHTILAECHVKFIRAGENIAYGTDYTPQDVVAAWMKSPGHRKNILNPDFTHIGIGYAKGERSRIYWAQMFLTIISS